VDLVVHEMVELEHVDVAHRHLAIELLAGAAVEHRHLAGAIETRQVEHGLDIGLLGAVEHRRRDRHAVLEVGASSIRLSSLSALMSSSSP